MPPLDDELKSREVVLGYLIDDKFMKRFYRHSTLKYPTISAGPFRRAVKGLIVRDASQKADCPVAILDVRENGTTEEAIIKAWSHIF